ncbi:MAG TPA: lactate racemase domain-containing protein [Ktedonobacteraceae bacterium]|jgi:hypothetical protein
MLDNIQVTIDGGFEVNYPRMFRVQQQFKRDAIQDIPAIVRQQFAREEIRSKLAPGMNVAIGVGSRGIAHLKQIVTAVVAEVKQSGGIPFIVPAMGSHGGATAEGQRAVLAEYGITEEQVGCPIRATMETVQIGQLPDSGLPLYFDKYAYESDAIIVIGRIKPHTDFKGPVESGLQKMLVIGLGKHKGASSIHSNGVDRFFEVIPQAGKILIEKTNVAMGIALLENAYDETAQIIAVPAEKICTEEPLLLQKAKDSMAKLLLDTIDVLVIDEFGKDISGAGMDPNVTGRTNMENVEGFDAPPIQKILVRDLTSPSHGNACGIGMADIITKRFYQKIDLTSTYINTITSTTLADGKIPLVFRNDLESLAIAVKSCVRIEYEKARIVWIKNTLHLEHIYVSEPYLDYVRSRDDMALLEDVKEIRFDAEGNLTTQFLF